MRFTTSNDIEIERGCLTLAASSTSIKDQVELVVNRQSPIVHDSLSIYQQRSLGGDVVVWAARRGAAKHHAHSGSKSGVSWDPSIFVIGWGRSHAISSCRLVVSFYFRRSPTGFRPTHSQQTARSISLIYGVCQLLFLEP